MGFQSPTVAIMIFIFFVEIYSFVFGHINSNQCIGMKTCGMGYTVNEYYEPEIAEDGEQIHLSTFCLVTIISFHVEDVT